MTNRLKDVGEEKETDEEDMDREENIIMRGGYF